MKARISFLLALTLLAVTNRLHAQGTAFTYQGQLQNNGSPASGTYNLTFTLFTTNTGGSAVAGPVTNNAVAVTNGLFTVLIDFGSGVWNGETNWLEIGVETNGAGAFTTLAPRQELTPTPYAIYAEGVTASGISGTLTNGQLLHSAVTVDVGAGLSGGGKVGLGNTIILTNTGVLSVAGNADITATTVGGAVTLGDTATSTDTASTLVKRDGSGSFSAASLTLDGTLTLPAITVSSPVSIYSGGDLLLYNDNNGNFFSGDGAGNSGTSGFWNTAIGSGALVFDSSGSFNTAVGYYALFFNTGSDNTAVGLEALTYNSGGSDNTAIGYQALYYNTGGSLNTANGSQALYNNTSGSGNTANGYSALFSNTNGSDNTANGHDALASNLSGSDNTAIGVNSLNDLSTGSNNIAVGYLAGYNITTGSGNIDIGNTGLSTDTNIIRIGSGQTKTYIAGVTYGNGSGLTNLNVSAAQLIGTVANSQLANSSITVNAGTGLSGGGAVTLGGSTTLTNAGVLSVTGNADITASTVGGAVTLGDTGTSSATPSTLVKRDATGSFSATNLTLNGVLNLPATTATAGIINSGGLRLVHAYGSQNFFAGPGAGNLTMSGASNTGNGYGALFSNTSGGNNTANGFEALFYNTNGFDNTAIGCAALNSNTGDVLGDGSDNTAIGYKALYANTIGNNNTANGYQALFSNTSGSDNTANGFEALYSNTNSGNTANGYQALYSNTSGSDNTASGAYALLSNTNGNYNTANGVNALNGNTSGSYNTANGVNALNGNTSGYYNTANGYGALFSSTNGMNNTANGYDALFENKSGNNNTANGFQALYNITSGSNNIALGYNAGYNLTTGTNNIDIGNAGNASDNNDIRIGTNGIQTAAYIAGISGATAASGVAVYVTTNGQLGTLTSSRSYKDDIRGMDQASDVLYALKPVTFKYKPGIDPQAIPQFGLVAEDVEKVAPDLVARDDQGKIYTVRYQAVDAMLLNEFLKEHRTVEEQNATIETLKQRLDKLERLIAQKTGGQL